MRLVKLWKIIQAILRFKNVSRNMVPNKTDFGMDHARTLGLYIHCTLEQGTVFDVDT